MQADSHVSAYMEDLALKLTAKGFGVELNPTLAGVDGLPLPDGIGIHTAHYFYCLLVFGMVNPADRVRCRRYGIDLISVSRDEPTWRVAGKVRACRERRVAA